MKLHLGKVKKDRIIRISIGISCVLFAAFTGLILFVQGSLPPYVPLINNVPWGVERLVHKNFLYVLPIVAICITCLNIGTAGALYEKNILMARIVSFNTLLFNLLALLALIQIILLVL